MTYKLVSPRQLEDWSETSAFMISKDGAEPFRIMVVESMRGTMIFTIDDNDQWIKNQDESLASWVEQELDYEDYLLTLQLKKQQDEKTDNDTGDDADASSDGTTDQGQDS